MNHLDYRPSYRRNLPHVQPPGATFFVTFRLAGSLPQSLILQWQKQRTRLAQWAETNPSLHQRRQQEFERVWFAKFESILDGGRYGPQWLRDERIADRMAKRLHDQNGKLYRLDSFSVMPNHVHVVFKPLPLIAEMTLPLKTRMKASGQVDELYHS
jgi:hypothetical protein